MRKSTRVEINSGLSMIVRELTVQEVILFLLGMDKKPFTDDSINEYIQENPSIILSGARDLIEFSKGDFEKNLDTNRALVWEEFKKVNSAYFSGDDKPVFAKKPKKGHEETALRMCNNLTRQCCGLINIGHSNCYQYGWWFFLQMVKSNSEAKSGK